MFTPFTVLRSCARVVRCVVLRVYQAFLFFLCMIGESCWKGRYAHAQGWGQNGRVTVTERELDVGKHFLSYC